MIEFFVIIDRESENPERSSNGGDYTEGRTVAVETSERTPFAVRYWSSADFDYCPQCGRYGTCDHEDLSPTDYEFAGWETGEKITDKMEYDGAVRRLNNGGFAVRKGEKFDPK